MRRSAEPQPYHLEQKVKPVPDAYQDYLQAQAEADAALDAERRARAAFADSMDALITLAGGGGIKLGEILDGRVPRPCRHLDP